MKNWICSREATSDLNKLTLWSSEEKCLFGWSREEAEEVKIVSTGTFFQKLFYCEGKQRNEAATGEKCRVGRG